MKEMAKVLFVDDEERIVRLLKIMFRDKYEVHTALSGQEALEVLKTHSIDVVVSDQRMPGMLGHELLAKIRAVSPHSVRVLLTGYSDLVSIIGAINEGEVYRFLNKPWNQDEIRAVVQECADLALSNRHVMANPRYQELCDVSPPMASATKLLALDGIASDRHEIMEMFTQDFNVFGASNTDEALSVLAQHDVGVVVASPQANEEDTIRLLSTVKDNYPFTTVVLVSEAADSKLLVKLINQGEIYRFAMKPMSPNLFRLAISAAMKEHHRRLADPRLMARVKAMASLPAGQFADVVIKNIQRFNDVW